MNRHHGHIETELLVLQCQAGDAAALRELVRRWNPVLLRHAARLLGRTADAHDVAQESWLAIVKGLGRLEDPACFPRWSLRIVTNKAADWIRRAQRDRDQKKTFASMNYPPVPSDLQSETGDDIARLRSALTQMPADRRALLAMLYLDGRSVAEIAETLAVTRGTVKSRLHHARNELKTILENSTSKRGQP